MSEVPIKNACILLTVGVLNKIVVIRNKKTHKWNIPGGMVDSGETPWNAAVREWTEETGIELPDLRKEGKTFSSYIKQHSTSGTKIYVGHTDISEKYFKLNKSHRLFNNETDDLQLYTYDEIMSRKDMYEKYAIKSLQQIYERHMIGGNFYYKKYTKYVDKLNKFYCHNNIHEIDNCITTLY